MEKNPCRFPYALCPPEVYSKMLCVACEILYSKTAVTLLNGLASPPNGEN